MPNPPENTLRQSGQPPNRKNLLIQGNFKPPKGYWFLKLLLILSGGLLVMGVIGAFVTTAVVVHYDNTLSNKTQATRKIHEENKTLNVKLQELQSFQAIESAAIEWGGLYPADEQVDIDINTQETHQWKPVEVRGVKQLVPEQY